MDLEQKLHSVHVEGACNTMNNGAEVNKGVFIAVIAAVVVIVGLVGYFVLSPPKAANSPDANKKYVEQMQAAQNTPGYPGGPNAGASTSSGGSSGGARSYGSGGMQGSSGYRGGGGGYPGGSSSYPGGGR